MKYDTTEVRTIGNNQVNSVLGRELHKKLEIGRDFTNWAKDKIEQCMLEQNVDFMVVWSYAKKGVCLSEAKMVEKFKNRQKATASGYELNYIFTARSAKEISMVTGGSKGKESRKYFLDIEEVAKDILGEDRLKLEIKALENKVEQDYIRGQIEIAKQLQDLGANLDPVALTQGKFVSKLAQGIGEALTDACSDIRVGIQVFSATHLLNENEIKMKPKDFNDALINAGMMEKYFYNNKPYKKFVNDMNYYGYNRDASSVKVNPVAPRFYEDRFINLLQLLRNEGYID